MIKAPLGFLKDKTIVVLLKPYKPEMEYWIKHGYKVLTVDEMSKFFKRYKSSTNDTSMAFAGANVKRDGEE